MLEPKKTKDLLRILERGIKVILTDKYAETIINAEHDVYYRGTEVVVIGRALGECIGEIEYPAHWKRFLKRKDCPQYMKVIHTARVNAYYPKLSLPDEDNWVTFETPVGKD